MSPELVTANYLWLIPAFPLAGVVFHATLGARLGRRAVNLIGPGAVALSFVAALYAVAHLSQVGTTKALFDRVYAWLYVGTLQLDVAFTVDTLTAVMILVVTGVGFLIHVYSAGYMGEDPDYARYFAYLNLFTFSMLILVMADNLVLLFVGWEGVGMCSYLLIGFWYEKPANGIAGNKAFIVNRIGDAAFLLGVFLLFWHAGGSAHDLSFRAIAEGVDTLAPGIVTAVTLLLFVGATGKSAQLPLYVWLPDAMAGPTPVSALIHAATMVTAGVYMIARLHFLYVLSPTTMAVVATVGAITTVFAATIALAQNDIKKVLAYSTISQLGYMFLACGVGAFTGAIFHLMTHAFFKALLFLGSGSVIHGMGGEQDMRNMGGLRRFMPTTYWTFLMGTLAIVGVAGFSGFFSKDEILLHAYTSDHGSLWLWGVAAAGVVLTAFYMTRLVALTFLGECRADPHTQHHIHEAPPSMRAPLIILAVLAVIGGYVGVPAALGGGNHFGHFLAPVLSGHEAGPTHDVAVEFTLMGVSLALAVGGMGLAYIMYVVRPDLPIELARRLRGLYQLLLNKYFVDEIYDAMVVRPTAALSAWLWRIVDLRVIDGIVNGTAEVVQTNGGLWRRLQDGNVQHYALTFLVGVVVILGYYAWR